MTVIGNDRPGLVESVASIVAEHGGNWLESRMSRLGGQFAGIVHVEVPAEREQALAKALKTLGLPVEPELAAGALIPLVLWAVWKATRRVHERLLGRHRA